MPSLPEFMNFEHFGRPFGWNAKNSVFFWAIHSRSPCHTPWPKTARRHVLFGRPRGFLPGGGPGPPGAPGELAGRAWRCPLLMGRAFWFLANLRIPQIPPPLPRVRVCVNSRKWFGGWQICFIPPPVGVRTKKKLQKEEQVKIPQEVRIRTVF